MAIIGGRQQYQSAEAGCFPHTTTSRVHFRHPEQGNDGRQGFGRGWRYPSMADGVYFVFRTFL